MRRDRRLSGIVQNRDGVVHLMARSIAPLAVSAAEIPRTIFTDLVNASKVEYSVAWKMPSTPCSV